MASTTQQNLAVFKPFRDRNVSVRSVACPLCQAPVGVGCVTREGNPVQHRGRRAAALRAERDAPETET